MSKIYTAILFDARDEEDYDTLFEYLIEDLDFDMDIGSNDTPATLLVKDEQMNLEDLSRQIKDFAAQKQLTLSNLMVFHLNSYVHFTDEKYF